MSAAKPPHLLELEYEEYAQEYLRRLPPEHFMEATTQSTQRKITVASFDLVHARRPEVQCFSELLVQYPKSHRRRPGQVVPDNMIVVWPEPIVADTSFDIPLQPAGPFWVLEYVSKSNFRKDYTKSFKKYERELQVPYCLIFRPEKLELRMYRHGPDGYVLLEANARGRIEVPPLEMELGLVENWVRFWYQGQLLPLPAELLERLDQTQQRAEQEKQRAELEKLRADALERQLEEERKARLVIERELEQLRSQKK